MNELQRLLGLTQQIQDGESYHVAVAASTGSVRCVCPLCQLRRVNLAALRTQLQQHADEARIISGVLAFHKSSRQDKAVDIADYLDAPEDQ